MDTALVINLVSLWVLVFLNLLLTLGLARRIGSQRPKYSTLKKGSRAPNFFSKEVNGESVSLADYDGKAVAFIFTSPHCQPCHDEIPKIEDLKLMATEAGVELVLVSDSDAEETSSFVDELGITLPMLVAPRQDNPDSARIFL